jgi:cystathionine gamma-synthase
MSELHRETRAVHLPVPQPTGSRPLGVPIYQSHLFSFDDADALAAAFEGPSGAPFYSRLGNPTVRALEEAVADLEGGAGAVAAASGMGAINAVLQALLRSGDHLIAQQCLYGGTYAIIQDLAERWGVAVTYVSGDDPDEVRAALRPETRMLYLETIANPTTQVTDLAALAAVAGEAGVVTVVDNTFAPLLCRPIEHGADVVVHSTTKFISGHGDVLGGIAIAATAELHRTIWQQSVELGASADPFAAWLTLRGIVTLPLRMERHCSNAQYLAERLSGHPAVREVRYPGLPAHPQYDLARRMLSAPGGMLAIELHGGRAAGQTFVEALRLAVLAVSLGEAKTLAMHPASTSHRMLDDAALAAAGFGAGTVRMAIGIEHPEDLWTDLDQALTKAL